MLETFTKKFNEPSSKSTDLVLKNIYFNEYFFFSQIKIKFNDFKNFIKISNLRLKLKNETFYLLSKPYNILNNTSFNLSKYNPYLLTIHDYFKQYARASYFYLKATRLFKIKSSDELFIFLSFQRSFFDGFSVLQN
jgi:hypothetical protein